MFFNKEISPKENFECSKVPKKSPMEYSSIYGSSSITSKVSVSWSSTSNGSIVSPRKAPLRTLNVNKNLNRDKWYKFSIEDIDFGQQFTNEDCDIFHWYYNRNIKSSLYKLWFKSTFITEGSFGITEPRNIIMQQRNSFSSDVYLSPKMFPYSYFTSSSAMTFPPQKNILFSCSSDLDSISSSIRDPLPTIYSSSSGKNWKPAKTDKTVPVSSIDETSPECNAVETLNKYFNQQNKSDLHELVGELDEQNGGYLVPVNSSGAPISIKTEDSNDNVQEFFKNWNVGRASSFDMSQPIQSEQTEASVRQSYKKIKKKQIHSEPIVFEEFIQENEMQVVTRRSNQNYRIEKYVTICKFCYKNGELSDIYTSHIMKQLDGTIICPILRKYVCDICGATGDNAHTRKYCSHNTQQIKSVPLYRRLTNGVLTSSHNHK